MATEPPPEPVLPACERDQLELERDATVVDGGERLQRRPVRDPEEVDELLRRAEAERERALGQSSETIPLPNRSRRCRSVPQSIGAGTPAGGGTWPATVRKSSPMKPSGVQLASAITPPGLQTRTSSRGCAPVVRREHRAEHRRHGVERRIRERERLGVAVRRSTQALGRGAMAAALEQGGHVVDADGDTAVPGRGDRGVAASGCDVEHMPAGPQIGVVHSCSATSTMRDTTTAKSPLAQVLC